jgi:hypothetical protein
MPAYTSENKLPAPLAKPSGFLARSPIEHGGRDLILTAAGNLRNRTDSRDPFFSRYHTVSWTPANSIGCHMNLGEKYENFG